MMSEDKDRVRTLLGKMKWSLYLESNSIILTAPGVTPVPDSFFNDIMPMFVESGYNPLHDQCIHYLAGAKNKTRFATVYDLCADLGLTTKNGNTFTHVVAFQSSPPKNKSANNSSRRSLFEGVVTKYSLSVQFILSKETHLANRLAQTGALG